MYPEYKMIQIVELPANGDLPPYAVRFFGRMAHFDFDFMCKNSIKKWFIDHNLQDGDYIILHDNEHTGDRYIVDAICNYRAKESGVFIEFKRPGDAWVKMVNDTLENTPIIDIGMKIQTMNRVNIPKFASDNSAAQAEE